ncbi:UDP-GalNAc:beta-1,3-N-acetylgalactosaminyltransferase 2-like isoform X2 [Limulus polyphemus]|uniref:Hexosyltransferase n=1 Tax=Limulus polyphemus TaxID=6850 RepID=A0ABM1SYW1_LIMPO|nr:UDP-GalNAc:beta-1,3-N-acetylgalactosaminyltransferase 2-like isoform X2 [Limulus polyphemus]
MNFEIKYFILTIVICIIAAIKFDLWNYCSLSFYSTYFKDSTSNSNELDLVIGILSSQDNFEERNAIRHTWLSSVKGNLRDRVKAWFVVGNDFCDIPPQSRVDLYSCNRWKINVTEITKTKTFSTCTAKMLEPCQQQPVHQGFIFQVLHSIIVEKLGVLEDSLITGENVTVTLLDAATRVKVTVANFSGEKPGRIINGYIYRPVQQYILPKGFFGLLLVEGVTVPSVCRVTEFNNGVVSIKKIYGSLSNSEEHAVATSFIFRVHELEKHVSEQNSRSEEWIKIINNTKMKLNEEVEKSDDMILIDTVDVYRNLPQKVVKFFQWLNKTQSFSFVLKTDDDCMIDIHAVLERLNQDQNFHSPKVWWSRFRSEYPVELYGKWGEWDYTSPVYPVFACGAGSVLSRDLVSWITQNTETLYNYQGEDVSMGIWLSAVKPSYVQDMRWNCDHSYTKDCLNRAELNVTEMYRIWKSYESCGSLCCED